MQALLVVGGHDPSGGAGVTQDALHAHDCGIWTCPVVSALTVQTPERFDLSVPTQDAVFIAMLEAAAESVDVAGVKIGYLASPAQAEYLAAFLRSLRLDRPGLPIVIDPVGVPTSGQAAPERHDVVRAIADKLVPLATVVTPNRDELAMLADHPTAEPLALEVAAKRIVLLGSQAVLVKAAEIDEAAVVDRYVTRYENEAIRVPRVGSAQIHGTGSAVAARLAARLALGHDGLDAAIQAVHDVATMRSVARVAEPGTRALMSPFPLAADPEAPEAVRRLEMIVPAILRILPPDWVPEQGSDLAFADADAEAPDEVASLRQRIHLRDGRPHAPAACWRAPSMMARVALAVRRRGGGPACVMNLRHTPAVFTAAGQAGLVVGTFDRSAQPADAVSTVEWGTAHVLEEGDADLVADDGGRGIEPMVRLLAADPTDLVAKLTRLARLAQESKPTLDA